MPTINAKGIDIYYQYQEADLSGSSLFFIHGSGGTHKIWRHQTSMKMNTIAIDLPGHGQSGGQAYANIEEAADLVAALLDTFKLPQPVFLVGHSMGAAISLSCALRHKELVGAIILVGGGAKLKVFPAVLESLAQGEINPDFSRIAFAPTTSPQLVENEIQAYCDNDAAVLYNDLYSCDQFDITAHLAQIEQPALLIVGDRDRLTPVKYSQFLHNNLQNSQLAIIKDAGHFALLEQPEEVNQIITKFVVTIAPPVRFKKRRPI